MYLSFTDFNAVFMIILPSCTHPHVLSYVEQKSLNAQIALSNTMEVNCDHGCQAI